jgi:LytS/YehU family sensor histidine kinase
LVENAVKHNEISTRKPLDISISITENDQLVVRNNLQPKKGSYESTKVGLKNISDRFTYFTDQAVNIRSDKHEFVVELPILKMNTP